MPQTGDKVRIVANTTGHGYKIGKQITLGITWEESGDEIYDPEDSPAWKGVETDDHGISQWWVEATDFVVVSDSGFEYGVVRNGDDPNIDDEDNGLHRGPWSEEKVDEWITEGELDGMRKGAFLKVRRPVGLWETVEDDG